MKHMISIAACAFGACLAATAVSAQEVGGRYAVEGSNPGGSGTYRGFVEIRGTSGGQCTIRWDIQNTPASDGFCMRQGDVFVAAYRLGSAIGLVTYRLESNGVLDGTWAIAGKQGVGRERLTPLR